MLDKAGYKGERIVLLHPSDHIYYNPTSAIVSRLLSQCGFNIDDQVMDWGTRYSRGGRVGSRWTNGGCGRFSARLSRCRTIEIRCSRRSSAATARKAGSAGPRTPGMEQIYNAWLEIDRSRRNRRSWNATTNWRRSSSLPFIPLGRYLQTSAWRLVNVRGIPKGPSAVFWNIEKT